jgi:hypothetical protein
VVEEYEIQIGESIVFGEYIERRPVFDGAVNASDAIGEPAPIPAWARAWKAASVR